MFSGPWDTDARDSFRVRFDEDVDAYDRTRPVLPSVVVDDIVGLAGLRSGSTVIEIGPARARPRGHWPSEDSASSPSRSVRSSPLEHERTSPASLR